MRGAAATALALALAGCAAGTAQPARPVRLAQAGTSLPQSPLLRGRYAGHRLKTVPPPLEIDHGPRTRRMVALTFDADMTHLMLARLRSGEQRTWYDAAIVGELEATRTPATIFLTGLWTEAYPTVVRRLAHDPLFELENHSVDHSGWLAPCYGLPIVRGALSKRQEIEQAAATIRRVAGVTPRYFRFPGGCHDAADLRLVAAAGERAVGWDVVSGDAFEADPRVIIEDVLRAVRPGSIVIMHLIGAPNAPATARALPVIIRTLRSRGYRFVTLRALLSSGAAPARVGRACTPRRARGSHAQTRVAPPCPRGRGLRPRAQPRPASPRPPRR
jgi:peptidoglycan/xylan/chitin deacetylase (PgdA/CDA1 family)